jgi:hypothetical protein
MIPTGSTIVTATARALSIRFSKEVILGNFGGNCFLLPSEGSQISLQRILSYTAVIATVKVLTELR